jgi:hypothetical protein
MLTRGCNDSCDSQARVDATQDGHAHPDRIEIEFMVASQLYWGKKEPRQTGVGRGSSFRSSVAAGREA